MRVTWTANLKIKKKKNPETRSLFLSVLFLFWAGIIPGAVQQSAVGQCDSDLRSLLEPCPHCVSACEEGVTTVPSPEFADTPSTMLPTQPTEPAFAFTEQTGALATPDFAAQPSVAGYILLLLFKAYVLQIKNYLPWYYLIHYNLAFALLLYN